MDDLKLGGFHFLDGKSQAHHVLPVCTYKLMKIKEQVNELLPILKQQHPPPKEKRRKERNPFTWIPIPLINREVGRGVTVLGDKGVGLMVTDMK